MPATDSSLSAENRALGGGSPDRGNPAARLLSRLDSRGAALLLVALLALVTFVNSLPGQFVLDDVAFYVDNPSFTADHNIGRFFRTSVWEHSILRRHSDPLYRPVFMTVMWLTQTLFGSHTVLHHLFNIGLHVLASIMVLLLLRRLLPADGWLPALAGAALFAVHPVHVEAVSWISAYGHPLATVFILGALLCYDRSLAGNTAYLLASLGLYCLAQLTIEVAIAFPLLVTAYDYLQRGRIRFCRLVPFWLAAGCYLLLRSLILQQKLPLLMGSGAAWKSALSFSVAYVEQLLVPWPQYIYLATPDQGIASATGGFLALAAVVAVVAALLKRTLPEKRLLAFGCCWVVFAMSAPVLAAMNPHPMFAARSLYLASVGMGLLAAWGYRAFLRERPLPTVIAGVILLVLALTAATSANRYWLSNLSVYGRILAGSPGSAVAAIKVADIYESRGNPGAAEEVLLKTLAKATDNPAKISLHERLGVLYGMRNDLARSEQQYRELLQLSPENSSAFVGLGNNALMRGDLPAALSLYLRAIEAAPDNREACYNVALTYQRLGDSKRAAAYFLRAKDLPAEIKPMEAGER